MNYKELYHRFLSTRPTRIRTRQRNDGLETHHIIPRSLGGTNQTDNLIHLTPKEHWIAHRILYRMTAGKEQSKMAYALVSMIGNKGYKPTARQYALLKHLNRNASKKMWQDPAYRAKQKAVRSSPEYKAKRRATYLETRARMVAEGTWRTFTITPKERLAKLQAKYGPNPNRSQRYYLRQVAKQI
jgi:hypothetical protein